MKAFVTGAGGYIGTALCKELMSRGYEVSGLAKNPARVRNLTDLGLDAFHGDIRYPDSIKGMLDDIDVVFHLVGTMIGKEHELEMTNVQGTRIMVEEATAAGVKTLVFASSGSVYGDHGEKIVDERSECHPLTAYGHTKFEAEKIVIDAASAGMIRGVVCRLAGVYGPRSQMLMLENAGRSQVRLVGSGDNWMSVIHLDDVVDMLIAAAERGQSGSIYNLTDDEPVQLKDFYNYLARRLGEPEAKHISEATARRLARIVGFFGRITGRAVVFNADFVKMIFSSLKLSNDKVKRDLAVSLRYPNYRLGLDAVLAELGITATSATG